MTDLRRIVGESEYEYIYRICKCKDSIGTWQDVADLLNKELGYEYTESKYRKDWQSFQKMFKTNQGKLSDVDAQIDELNEARLALAKEKVKISDERVALSRQVRELARHETTLEMVKRIISESVPDKYTYSPPAYTNSDNDLIVHLTDIHVGMGVNNFFNSYDLEIMYDRLFKYMDKIFTIKQRHNSEKCYLILGGDLISGLIRFNIRCENNENLIEQIKIASEALSKFAYELSKGFSEVHVHLTPGNHSRAVAEKKLSLKGENLDKLIPFYMRAKLQNQENIIIHENHIEESVAIFDVRGLSVFASHGDKDSPKYVVQSLTLLMGKQPDVVFLGHRHENGLTTVANTKVIQSGSVIGMDNYTLDLRLVGKPEQSVAVVSDDGYECLYDIQLSD